MTNRPPPLSVGPATPARRRKLLAAIVVFLVIIGSYSIVAAKRLYDQLRAPLPGSEQPTGPCSLWFIGSSSIFKWTTLAHDMVPWDAHNRGINGATFPFLTRAFANEPDGPPPAAIILYAGENDIAEGADAARTDAALIRFMATKTRRYGPLPVIAVSLKPSPTRWANLPTQTDYNNRLRRHAAMRSDLHFVNIRAALLVDGRPGPFYAPDGIHMNAAGYARWVGPLRRALDAALPVAARTCGSGRSG